MNKKIADIIGIGIGPFNLGLAALLLEHRTIQAKFLERKHEFQWHKGLLLSGATLQVPFFADLVTMADPCHRLSYLNYLHQHDRLYQFYYYEHFLIPRVEYNHYCRWAATQLPSCNFGEHVDDVTYDAKQDHFVVDSTLTSGEKAQGEKNSIAAPIWPLVLVQDRICPNGWPKITILWSSMRRSLPPYNKP